MARIRFDGREAEVADGARVLDTCDALGVPFGCQDGVCGTCISRVIQGMENLGPINDKEADMGLEAGQRLVCQCVIRSGLVEFALD